MKTRSGVPESRAYEPALPSETRWLVTPRKGDIQSLLKGVALCLRSSGPTAFIACAKLVMSLGEVADIRPATEAKL